MIALFIVVIFLYSIAGGAIFFANIMSNYDLIKIKNKYQFCFLGIVCGPIAWLLLCLSPLFSKISEFWDYLGIIEE